jgi:hypothetical protein
MSSPATADPPDLEEEYDFTQLDPANLMKGMIEEQVEIPKDPAAAPDPIGDLLARQTAQPADPSSAPAAAPVQTPAPTDTKPEGTNFRELRKAREAAEKEREQFRTERDALAAKLADLEPRAKNYEVERETLTQQLQELTQAHTDAQTQVWRVDARQKPEWQEKATSIKTAAATVQEIMALPAVREAGLNHSVATLLDPNPQSRAALNETIRALNESGHFAEAQDLIDSHRAVNTWRGELRKIEEGAAEEAKAWQTNRETTAMGVVRGVREQIAQANPIHDTRSPEFLALPKEQQEFLVSQHTAAEAAAREVLTRTTRPDMLVADAYRTQLEVLLSRHALQSTSTQLSAAQKELTEIKAKLAAYEKAAGGGVGGGSTSGGGGQTPGGMPDDLEELAKMLDPRNMPGYRGL